MRSIGTQGKSSYNEFYEQEIRGPILTNSKKNLVLFVVAAYSSLAFANQVAVDVVLSPAGSFKARTSKVSGIAYKTADGVAAENVVIDATTLETGVALRDKHLKEHLLTQKYPQIKLLKAIGKNGQGKGEVEIMGKKQPVNGTYKIDGEMLKAQFKMKLTDLEIKGVRYMGVGVKDEVNVSVDLPIKAKK